MSRPFSHLCAEPKTAATIGSVSPCPIPHLSDTRSIRRVTRRPHPHFYRPIPSLLPARNLTRLRPISHATRPFSHFSLRKPLKFKADLPPESESELNRTLEGKSRAKTHCGYVDNYPVHVSLTLDTADAKPLTRFAMPISPHPSLAHSRSLRRTSKRTIGISRLQQGFKRSRLSLAFKLESETSAISAGNLLGEASKRVFWRKPDGLRYASKVRSFGQRRTLVQADKHQRSHALTKNPPCCARPETKKRRDGYFRCQPNSSHFSRLPKQVVRRT